MVVLAPLVPAAGKAALVLAKGGLTRSVTRSLIDGAARMAGAEIVYQIAEWARSIDGEFDTTDSGSGGIDGCKEITEGGYGQAQLDAGGGWTNMSGSWIFSNAVRLGEPVYGEYNGGPRWYSNISVYSAADGTTSPSLVFDTEAEARSVKYRIQPIEGDCKESGSPSGPDMTQPLPLPPMQAGDCNINVAFHGFLAAEDGTGTVRPVFEWTPADAEQRTGGGVITGGCNFQPTISVGGGGDGGDPPIFVPSPGPGGGGGGSGGDGWWEAVAKGAAVGAVGAIVNKLAEGLLTQQDPASFTLEAPCDVDDDDNPLTYTVNFPQESQQDRIQRWQVAQAYLLQQHLNWKTPTCSDRAKPELEGTWISTRWESDSNSPASNRPLRKLFRYRSKSTRDDEQLREYWSAFQWEAGSSIVVHKGAWWGTPKVWAASPEEGKRVLRFAGLEAGIDPDQTGEWIVSGSDSPRYGMSGTMRLEIARGMYWVTRREGPSGVPG